MFSRSRKMVALVCSPCDSGTSDEEDEMESEAPHEINELLNILDDDLQDYVNVL